MFKTKPFVSRRVFASCTKVSPLRSVFLCVAIYLGVFLLAFVGSEWSDWALAPVSFLLIAGLQSHLLILLHEGSHYLMHPNRKWNDRLTDFFCGIPLLILTKNYRAFHLAHHRFSGDPEKDPEVGFYKDQGYHYEKGSKVETLVMPLKDLIGFNSMIFVKSLNRFLFEQKKENGHDPFNLKDIVSNLFFWGVVWGAAIYFGWVIHLLVFWIIPYLTLGVFFLKLHGYGEHTGLEGPTELERTWIHEYNPVTNFFIYPINSGYHVEHHLYPSVPWYYMKRFRNELMKDYYYKKQTQAVTSTGYFFGENTIFGSMILGKGRYTDEEKFQSSYQSRLKDLESIEQVKAKKSRFYRDEKDHSSSVRSFNFNRSPHQKSQDQKQPTA
jgi:fatty acid desaturase